LVCIGIIGAGFGRTAHLSTFRSLDGVEVLAIADSGSGKRVSELAAGVGYCQRWQDLIALPDLNAISIATPPKLHHEIACAALRRGLHVWCEKPFGMSVAEAEEMKRCADDSGTVLGVNFQFRYEPGIRALANALHGGVIGNFRRLDFAWLTAGRAGRDVRWSWQNEAASGGGVIAGFFSHVADLAAWISRREVVSVYGRAQSLIETRVDMSGQSIHVTAEDSVDACMVMQDQIVSSVRISNVQPGGQGMVIEAAGDSGRLVYTHKPPYLPEDASVTLYTLDGKSHPCELCFTGGDVGQCQDTRFSSTRRSAHDFIRAVRGESVAGRPTAGDAIKAHAVMRALRRALVSRSAEVVSYDGINGP
jgi:predicted dehydrogenase